jgi:hypothetical protein
MLLELLQDHGGKTLRFVYDGREIRPGYHVTEVKSGRFDALDCGANPESWRETFIQLWDLPAKPGDTFMRVGKFLAIMRKVIERVPFDDEAKLTFEVSDGDNAVQLFKAVDVLADSRAVHVFLARRSSSCKPRDRWLEQHHDASAGCGCSRPPAQAAAR